MCQVATVKINFKIMMFIGLCDKIQPKNSIKKLTDISPRLSFLDN